MITKLQNVNGLNNKDVFSVHTTLDVGWRGPLHMACPLAVEAKASVSIVGSFADGALGLQYFVHTAFDVGGRGAHHSNP